MVQNEKMTPKIAEMRNLGPNSERNLIKSGITTPQELHKVGAVAAYHALKFFVGPQVTLNFLWGIEGALTDTDWRDITPERKAELKELVNNDKP